MLLGSGVEGRDSEKAGMVCVGGWGVVDSRGVEGGHGGWMGG